MGSQRQSTQSTFGVQSTKAHHTPRSGGPPYWTSGSQSPISGRPCASARRRPVLGRHHKMSSQSHLFPKIEAALTETLRSTRHGTVHFGKKDLRWQNWRKWRPQGSKLLASSRCRPWSNIKDSSTLAGRQATCHAAAPTSSRCTDDEPEVVASKATNPCNSEHRRERSLWQVLQTGRPTHSHRGPCGFWTLGVSAGRPSRLCACLAPSDTLAPRLTLSTGAPRVRALRSAQGRFAKG